MNFFIPIPIFLLTLLSFNSPPHGTISSNYMIFARWKRIDEFFSHQPLFGEGESPKLSLTSPIPSLHHTTPPSSRNIYYDNLYLSLSFLYVLLKNPSGWLVGHIRKRYMKNIKHGFNKLNLMTPISFACCGPRISPSFPRPSWHWTVYCMYKYIIVYVSVSICWSILQYLIGNGLVLDLRKV